ncbi:hypothetical protein BGZ81_005187 [Podila clonocystis]|nr:hypothetical protein BGZ81_005187 [Podila clonocystis]
MFNIPELDLLISRLLDRSDLAIATRFGGLIQRIDDPTNLLTALTTPPTGTAIATTSDLPSGLDLLQHAISKFTGITELHLQEGFYNSDRLYKLLSPTMGMITHLKITCNNNGKDLRSLERLRSLLESTDSIDTLVLSIGNIIAEPASSATIMSKPTVLRLINLGRKLDMKAAKALSWLWQSCGDVKELELQAIDWSAMQQMPTVIQRMTVLTVIILGKEEVSPSCKEFSSTQIASIVKAGIGWIEIRCGQTAEVGRDAVQAIIQYAATLKTLHICRVEEGTKISPILASCGNLEEFVTIKNRRFCNVRIPEVKARELLEKQEDGSLWPWKSEKSLKHLAMRVSATGQARQPNAEEPIISDQSNVEYQQNLCLRLARFTEVSVLWLGHVHSASKIVANNSIQTAGYLAQ